MLHTNPIQPKANYQQHIPTKRKIEKDVSKTHPQNKAVSKPSLLSGFYMKRPLCRFNITPRELTSNQP